METLGWLELRERETGQAGLEVSLRRNERMSGVGMNRKEMVEKNLNCKED